MELSRKQFFEMMLTAAASAVGFRALAGCNDDNGGGREDAGGGGSGGTATGGSGGTATGGSGGTATGGSGGTMGVTSCDSEVQVVLSHTHQVTVPAADANAGVQKTYTLSNVGHTHQITVTAAMFDQLAAGGTVMVESTVVENHQHMVTITCE